MQKKPTILILATQTGGGHVNLARSLRGMLEDRYNVVIEDGVFKRADRFYGFVSSNVVQYLRWQYTLSNNAFIALLLHRVVAILSRRRLDAILERVQPQLIIVTHAYLSYATARANERRPRRVPLVFQLTDLAQLHLTWFTEKRADAYLAPSREIFEQACRHGIDGARLFLTGRPVRGQFIDISSYTRVALLTSLGLDPSLLTLFLQRGAMGPASVDRRIELLLGAGVPLQIVLATGQNEHMIAQYATSQQVRPIPFTEAIAPYMAAADVIAGKAGASFITEAFMLEKPFLVTDFIPGQETANLRFIEQHNLGWVRADPAAQRALLATLANAPELIAAKLESIQAQRAWNMQAVRAIGPIIDKLLS